MGRPSLPTLPNGNTVETQEKPDFLNSVTSFFDDAFMNRLFDGGVKALLILFGLGILVMIMSAIFKNGQWQKYAQGTLLWSFLAICILRGIGLLIVTIQSVNDVENLLALGLTWMTHIALFLGLVGFVVSLMYKFAHALIKHPDYYKSSKLSFGVSLVMIMLALFVPPLINLTS